MHRNIFKNRFDNKKNKWLTLILLLYFVLAINYALNVPIFEAPDEPDHFAHIKYLVNNKRLPFLNVKTADEPATAIHPPLYYFLSAIIYAPFQVFDHPVEVIPNEKFSLKSRNKFFHGEEKIINHIPFYIIRLFSIMLGMGTIIFGWKIAAEFFRENHYLVNLSAALIAFIPQFVYVSSVINSDNLANFISTIAFWILIKVAQKEYNRKIYVVFLGILTGLAAITKFTVLFLIPFSVIVFYIIKNNKKEFYGNVIIIFVLVIVVSGWYYLRNYLIYGFALGGNFVIKRSIFSSYFIKPFANIMLLSFFGLFGWMSILMGKLVYCFYILFYGFGFFTSLGFIFKNSSLTEKHPDMKVLNWILFLSIILSLASNIRYNMNSDDYQGRHMLPIIAPFAVLTVQGFYYIFFWFKGKYLINLSEKIKTIFIVVLIFVLAYLNIFVVNTYIKQSFAGAFI
ncbi:MAG: hypothetical protein AB1498_12010 [bacterium]